MSDNDTKQAEKAEKEAYEANEKARLAPVNVAGEDYDLEDQSSTVVQDRVAGYDVRRPGYDWPYLDGAHFDPAEDFRHAGDPDAQAKHGNKRDKLKQTFKDKVSKRRKDLDKEERGTVAASSNPNQQSNASPDTVDRGVLTEGQERVPNPDSTKDDGANANDQLPRKTVESKTSSASGTLKRGEDHNTPAKKASAPRRRPAKKTTTTKKD